MPAGMSRKAFIPVFVLAVPSLNYKNVFICYITDGPVMQHTVNDNIGKYIGNKRVDGFMGACNTLCQCFEVSRQPYKHLKTVSQS